VTSLRTTRRAPSTPRSRSGAQANHGLFRPDWTGAVAAPLPRGTQPRRDTRPRRNVAERSRPCHPSQEGSVLLCGPTVRAGHGPAQGKLGSRSAGDSPAKSTPRRHGRRGPVRRCCPLTARGDNLQPYTRNGHGRRDAPCALSELRTRGNGHGRPEMVVVPVDRRTPDPGKQLASSMGHIRGLRSDTVGRRHDGPETDAQTVRRLPQEQPNRWRLRDDVTRIARWLARRRCG